MIELIKFISLLFFIWFVGYIGEKQHDDIKEEIKKLNDRIRTMEQVVSKTETSASEKPTNCKIKKGGEQ